jgi:hypothetical protein
MWVVNAKCRQFTAGNEPVRTIQEAGRGSGLVRTSVENLTPLGFDPHTIQSVVYCWEWAGTHRTGGWAGLRTCTDECGKSRPTGIRSLYHPLCSQSLYWLSYPGAHFTECSCHKFEEFLRENLAVSSQTTKQLCQFPPDNRRDSSNYKTDKSVLN